MGTNAKGFFTASIIFLTIIVVIIGASSFFSPGPLLFSEDFENATRNQQYTHCPNFFTIVDGRLRVTIANSYSGCAVQLPNEYEEFVFTAYVHPVGDVHDGSINIIFGQAGGHAYEIQYRPKEEQVNYIETVTNSNQEKVVRFTTGWQDVTGTRFNNSANKIKLVVTRRLFDFGVNDSMIFHIKGTADNQFLKGAIHIGAGAGEQSNIVFEFDNVKISKLMPFVRWFYDYSVKKDLEKYEADILMQNGLCLDCDLPHPISELSLR